MITGVSRVDFRIFRLSPSSRSFEPLSISPPFAEPRSVRRGPSSVGFRLLSTLLEGLEPFGDFRLSKSCLSLSLEFGVFVFPLPLLI